MARPNKINIGSFPFSVDFFDNKIMVRIAGEFGVKGEIIAVKLLCAVYKQGYFLKWSIDELYLLKRLLPGISTELLQQVIERLLKWGFFDEGLFRSAEVLTSVEVQKNYFNAIRRRTGINRNSFPYLLIDPDHPNNVSAYRNKVFVDNNSISVNNNSDNVTEKDIYVINKRVSVDNKAKKEESQERDSATKKEFLYTEMGVSVDNNPNNCNNNPDLCNNNPKNGYKNPLEEHFETKKEILHTGTGVSVDNNSGLCIQKQKEGKNNNSQSVIRKGDNVNINPVTVSNNDKPVNKKSNSDSNNPDNIIYNSIYNHHNNLHILLNQESLQNFEFGKQKGIESLQELESTLKDFLKDEIWIDGFCKTYKVQKSELPKLLEDFKHHCISEGNVSHTSYNKTKQHFCGWLRITQNPQNLSSKQNGSKEIQQRSKDRRRGTEANCKEEKNYYESF